MEEYSSAKTDMDELFRIQKIMKHMWEKRWRGEYLSFAIYHYLNFFPFNHSLNKILLY